MHMGIIISIYVFFFRPLPLFYSQINSVTYLWLTGVHFYELVSGDSYTEYCILKCFSSRHAVLFAQYIQVINNFIAY